MALHNISPLASRSRLVELINLYMFNNQIFAHKTNSSNPKEIASVKKLFV